MSTVTYVWNIPNSIAPMNNIFSDGTQGESDIAALAGGNRYLGVWTDPSTAIRGRFMIGGANPLGDEFTVATSNSAAFSEASVAGLTNGGAVVTYTHTHIPSGDSDIRMQLFNAAGAPIPAAPSSNSVDDHDDIASHVAALDDGRFVVTWTREFEGLQDLRYRIFNAGGQPATSELHVNNSSLVDTPDSSVAVLAGGGFVVCWTQHPVAGGDSEVFFRRFDESGNPLDGTNIEGVLIDAVGSVNEDIQVAALPDGGFVVAYTDNGWNPSNTDITVRICNADGSPRSGFFRANSATDGDQDRPTLAVLSNGFFVVGYTTDAGNNLVYQAFDLNGLPVGEELAFPFASEGEVAALGAGMIATIRDSMLADSDGGIASSRYELWRSHVGDQSNEVFIGDSLGDFFLGGGGNDLIMGGPGSDTARYTSAAVADYEITLLDNGDVRVSDLRPGAPDGTDTLHEVEYISFSTQRIPLSYVVNFGVAPLGDTLWRHSDGRVATLGHDLGNVANTWQICGTGDFDGDGDADIVWRHDDGQVVTWEMENGAYAENHNLASVANTWQIRGTGDFDHDGDADILWRHDDGMVVSWEMEDGLFVVNHNLGSAPSTWHIAGTGDFDHDGDADILWRHQDGQVVSWEMENGLFVVNHNLGNVPTNWQIRGTGDFDHDGDADILWRHNDGSVVTWEMENGAYVVNHNLPSVSSAWQIQGVHDFDSDGDADILFRHTEGQVVTWEMENGAYLQNHNYGVVWNAWQIRGVGEFDLV